MSERLEGNRQDTLSSELKVPPGKARPCAVCGCSWSVRAHEDRQAGGQCQCPLAGHRGRAVLLCPVAFPQEAGEGVETYVGQRSVGQLLSPLTVE